MKLGENEDWTGEKIKEGEEGVSEWALKRIASGKQAKIEQENSSKIEVTLFTTSSINQFQWWQGIFKQ